MGAGMKGTKFDDATAEALKKLDLRSFTKAWVAGLVTKNIDSVRPHDPDDRRGFANVIRVLDQEVEDLSRRAAPTDAVLPLLRIANELRQSNTGAYSGFEAALRSLQLTFTSSPNPWYDYIEFPVSRTQAESFIRIVPEAQRAVVQKAVDAFVAAKGAGGGSDVHRQGVKTEGDLAS